MEKIPNIEKSLSYSETIKPKNSLEESIILDPDWQKGSLYGKPREGHPEGAVIFHIVEVLNNIENLSNITESEKEKLRLVAILHDAFKYRVDSSRPRRDKNQHGAIARKFAEKYTDDAAVLMIIQFHDQAYDIWRRGNGTKNWSLAEDQVRDLIMEIGEENVRLYTLFYQCDNATGTKSRENFNWFKGIVGKYLDVH